LLNILSARFPIGDAAFCRLSGSIYLNGKPRDEERFRKVSAYVLQDDNMYAHLTVYETLMLSAHFFLSSAVNDESKADMVMKIITELGLLKAKDTIIGNENIRGVSGGERKRVSIAVQLLTDPAVLFLDEPTSGLDAFQSQAVMEVLKNLASKGRLVITVIHQPRSSIYCMFDQLLVLSEGNCMYFGATEQAVGYFASLGHQCPEHFNPADYLLDLLSPDNRSPELERETHQRITSIARQYQLQHGDLDLVTKSTMEDSFVSIRAIGGDADLVRSYRSFVLLCWRSWTEQSRNIPVIVIRFTMAVCFALLIGGIFSDTSHDQRSIQNRRGVLYFVLINQAFDSLQSVLATFPNEKSVISRERASNSYSILAYCVAKIFVEAPLNLASVLMYCLIVHPLANLNPNSYGYFILICLFANFTVTLLGLSISSFAPNAAAADAMGPPFLIIGILFGGFYIKISSLPVILDWIPWISVFQWTFRGLCTNEFKGLHFTCDASSIDQCTLTGEEALKQLDFDGHTTSYAMFGLGMLMLCYLGGLYLLLVLNDQRYLRLGHVGHRFVEDDVEAMEGAKILSRLPQEEDAVLSAAEARPSNYQLLYAEDNNDSSGVQQLAVESEQERAAAEP
jgi:ABC-type multidrug transport system ATPase subunit/ABC-type multidrug transport system permease subunit